MTWGWLGLSLLTIAFGDAVHLAMVQTTRSAIEREAEERGLQSRAAWIARRWRRIEEAGAVLRVAGRVAFVLLAVAGWPEAPFWQVGLVAGAVIWVAASIIPSVVARHAGDAVLLRVQPLMRLLATALCPLTWLGEAIEAILARMLGGSLGAEGAREEVREEVLDVLGEAERAGGIDPVSAGLIENVVEFASTTVSEVMTPRTEIEALAYTDDLAEVGRFLSQVGHSRIPVYDGSIDHVIGVLHVRDLVPLLGTDGAGFRLADRLRPPVVVPETKRVRDLLLEFQRSKSHLAIVVDEFGGTAGLATIEDALEEIVGEIRDEHDALEAEPAIVQAGPGIWRVPARTRISAVNDATGLAIPEAADHDTIAGHVLARTGRIPAVGETVQCAGFAVRITRGVSHRLDEVELRVHGEGA